jgi:2-succinyl-5-enolpyruvyl-6-hydroxy-3-cyclohexene-1-carboxylate synthase
VNPSSALATVLVDELVRQGVREAVLCPGSRSAAFAYALQEADRSGRLRLHVRVDERSAGFLALGLAKLTRRPVPVFTTSGTAVANLHPAVLEAGHACVPMIIVSADRPAELQGTGANQTTDQTHLFGAAVRMFHQLGVPERREGQNAVWRSVVGRLCAAATGLSGPDAGPVHLNVPLREPLVPDLVFDGEWPESMEGRDDGVPWVRVLPASHRVEGLATVPKTLIVLGDLPDPAMAADVRALARASGWPLIAEPFGAHEASTPDGRAESHAARDHAAQDHTAQDHTAQDHTAQDRSAQDHTAQDRTAQDRTAQDRSAQDHAAQGHTAQDRSAQDRSAQLPHGPLLLTAGQWLESHLPDRVLVVGRITLSRPVADLLRNPLVPVEIVTAQSDWPDPAHVASVVHPFEVVRASIAHGRRVDEDWARTWFDAGEQVSKAAVASIEASWPSGLAIASTVLAELPPEATLFVGSSSSARDVDLAMSPSARSAPLTVVASRGLAGIDGCVSTAIGLALARPHVAAYALMGDLTFLHDSNGLLIGPHEPRPDLTVVVTNDDGGGIFTLLEPGEPGRAADFERIFGTPTGVSIADICRAHRVRHTLASTQAELRTVLRWHPGGLIVVEVRVDRSGHRDLHAELRAAAAQALS